MCSVYAEVVNEIGLIVTACRAFVFTVRASKYRNAESNGGERQRAAGSGTLVTFGAEPKSCNDTLQ
jgi:hypothetical protein